MICVLHRVVCAACALRVCVRARVCRLLQARGCTCLRECLEQRAAHDAEEAGLGLADASLVSVHERRHLHAIHLLPVALQGGRTRTCAVSAVCMCVVCVCVCVRVHPVN